jgi:hypothetical protein
MRTRDGTMASFPTPLEHVVESGFSTTDAMVDDGNGKAQDFAELRQQP